MFNETQGTTPLPPMNLEMQVIDSQNQLKNIQRLLNGEIKGVSLPISDAVRDTLLIEAACLETGLVGSGIIDTINKVNKLVATVRRLGGAA